MGGETGKEEEEISRVLACVAAWQVCGLDACVAYWPRPMSSGQPCCVVCFLSFLKKKKAESSEQSIAH